MSFLIGVPYLPLLCTERVDEGHFVGSRKLGFNFEGITP